jgi:hypothetical protein
LKPPSLHLPEADARAVLMLRAFETHDSASPLWTAEDRAWATRLARETGTGLAEPARALAQRAAHALQRLAPRDAGVRARLAWRMGGSIWVPVVLSLAFAAGLLADSVGGNQRVNLLAPPVWAVIVWNLAVYLGLLVTAFASADLPRGLRAWLSRRLGAAAGARAAGSSGPAGPLAAYGAAWAQAVAPLAAARAGVLLHLAAAALALGLIAGLYGRGLVLDYRAGWESTFLDPVAVHAALALLLAPATALTGIPVPDVAAIEALRVAPAAAQPVAPAAGAGSLAAHGAAPWLHLFAAMLLLFVVLPRLALAAGAAVRAAARARRVELPADDYFSRLLRELQGRSARVQVLPHGAAPSPQAALALQAWLAAACGEGMTLQLTPATAYGQEDDSAHLATLAAPADTNLRVLLVDLGSTPEADTHGRLLAALQAQVGGATAVQWLVLADEATFRSRFAQLADRLEQRRRAWQGLAEGCAAGFVSVNLAQPDHAQAEAALQAALARPAAPGP